MLHYSKFLVKAEDEFNSLNYPLLVQELDQINEASVHVPQTLKAEILISFTKNHSLKHEWIATNPKFTALLTSGTLPTGNIASLFEASSKNSLFQKQFELFLQQSMNHMPTTLPRMLTDD
jgi:hypothetical protein